jgi:proteasome accessory factor C
LVATPGLPQAPDLASALGKLRETLGPETLDADGLIEVTGGGTAPHHLDLLRAAAEAHHRVEIEYFSASSGAWSTRTVEPEAVFSSLGNWYVAAWDLGAGAERLFRADRVRRALDTGERFDARGLAGAGRDLYTPGVDDVPVRLRLRAGARWIAEYYATVDPVELDDGSLEVTLPARRLEWIAKLLLRVMPDAEILAPDELRDELRSLAERTRERYGG